VKLGTFKILTPFAKRLDNWVLLSGLNLATWKPKKKNPLKYMPRIFVKKKKWQSHQGFLFFF
jgi:hypothetical protein